MTTFKMEFSDDNVDDFRKIIHHRWPNLETRKTPAADDYNEKFAQLLRRKFDGWPSSTSTDKNKFQEKIAIFNGKIRKNEENLRKNPFSDSYRPVAFSKTNDVGIYGRPESGSLTEKRGVKAGNHIGREILELCQVIDDCGHERPDGVKIITFGHLFQLYTKISDKVVGMLLRARRHGLVKFEGEMLYQRRDEEKIISLAKSFSEIEKLCKQSNDPAKCITFSD
uniref:Costars domain-containing protein n=1 Tax=Romanomermis culicivorax TaxID=13658 RepID=A0A915ITR5_ROMCU